MALPAPKLDDRTFQDIVNETKRLIPRYCPEWTDHNVSDPGVTMIELFAYMVDLLLFRLNRVPERNYVKWLEMLGIKLEPPKPSRSDVIFYLTGPQPDTVMIPLGSEIATIRTKSQNSIGFSTDYDLTIYVPTLFQVLITRGGDQFHDYIPAMRNPALNVGIFQDPPQPNDSLYFGFYEDLKGHILRFDIDSKIEGIGVDPKDPPLAWEYWDGQDWGPMFMELDTTGGLNRNGEVIVHVPFAAKARDVDGKGAFWLRCRATSPRPKQPAYSAAPRVSRTEVESLGGIVPSSQVETIRDEVLGRSNGKAGQEFRLNFPPVLHRKSGEVLEVEQEGGSFAAWEEVEDFGATKPGDQHYTVDSLTGILRFGPVLRDAAGREIQYGEIVPEGRMMRFTRYRTGGGTRGNVGKNTINVMKSSIPFVSNVTNAGPATGGEDAHVETLEMAMMRGPQMLRARARAVTTDDFEYLAKQATPEVSRARAVPPTPADLAAGKTTVRLLLVPESSHIDTPIPPHELRINERARSEIVNYLEARRLLTYTVQVEEPAYRYVAIAVEVRARKRANKEQLQTDIQKAMYRLINPVNGGPEGEGWPWERSLFPSEVTALVQGVDGVEYVESIRFYVVDVATGTRSAVEGTITCPPNGLLASYSHAVSVK